MRSRTVARTGLYAVDLRSRALGHRLLEVSSNVVPLSSGHLLYAEGSEATITAHNPFRDATAKGHRLVIRRFDIDSLEPVSEPVTLIQAVRYQGGLNLAAFSASPDGTLTFREPDTAPTTRLRWFDEKGEPLDYLGGRSFYPHPEISPDGARVAFNRLDPATGMPDIWIADLTTATERRLTFDAAVDALAVWSPDGRRIAFTSDRTGVSNLFVKPANGAEPESPLATSSRTMYPTSWSPDGSTLLFQHYTGQLIEMWGAFVSTGQIKPVLVNSTASQGRFSPDGRWILYSRRPLLSHSDVQLEPYPPTGAAFSVGPGRQARWRPSGGEIYYLSEDWQSMMAVGVSFAGGAPRFDRPRRLFPVNVWPGPPTPRNHFAVSNDGRRFLIDTLEVPSRAGRLKAMVNLLRP